MRKPGYMIVLCGAMIALFVAVPSVAVAFDESTSTIPSFSAANCGNCHDPYFSVGRGVHGGYTTTTTKCEECHSTHDAYAAVLLPASTIQSTCFTCHDGTQGRGVYGAIAARGVSVAASHSVETTNVVPGGDPATGGSKTMTFKGVNGRLTCTDCHSPHGSNVVTAFPGDRYRYVGWGMPPASGRLLRTNPGDSATSTANYGSDWCLACHQGRNSALAGVHNHPAESKYTTSVPFTYNRVAVMTSDAISSTTTYGAVGATNRGYLMPYPRTPQQSGHLPICQQCHEDNRNVGVLVGTGDQADPATFTASTNDGINVNDNPRFGTFPHESTGYRLLVEATSTAYYDDLCLNCHPVGQLP